MRSSCWSKQRRISVTALVLVLWSLAVAAAPAAEPMLGPKKAEDANKLNQLAQDLEKDKVNVANWLRTNLGFSPELDGFPLDVHAYFDLPDVVKLRAAFEACENAKANSGVILLDLINKRRALEDFQKKNDRLTDKDLAAARKMAEEIIALFKKLNPDFKLEDTQTTLVKFVFKPAPERPKLSDQDRQRLAVLAQYLEQARNGGPVESLKRYFDLDADAAHLLVWESGTVALTFERALARKLEKEPRFLQLVIKRINEDALKHKDHSLERTALLWSKAPKKDASDAELPAPTEQRSAKIPVGPAAVLSADKRAEIYRKNNEKAVSLKPAEVRKRADNPTGIFLASEIRADKDLPKPSVVEYTPGSDAANGKLTITFVDGSKRSLGPVQAEEAWMAYELAYGASAAKATDGIELLVLDGPHSYYEVQDGKLISARRREVIVHPALLGRELGLACARIDGMPRTRHWLLEEINADPVWGRFDREQAARRRKVLEQTADWVFDPWTNLARKYGAHSSVFRVTDVPLLLRGGDGVLSVERDDPDNRWSDAIRRRTFIEAEVVIQKYSQKGRSAGDVKRPENYENEAYKLMAELVPASAELQRLNNFAAVLGVVRWAKSNDAKFTAPAKPKEGPRTPEAVALFPEKTVPLAGHATLEVLKRETAKLDAELRKIGDDDQVKKFQDLCEKVIETEDRKTLSKLAKEAGELSRSSPEVRLFEELVQAKYEEILLIGRKTTPGNEKKPDVDAEIKRLKPMLEKLDTLEKESPAEFLIGRNLILRYFERLKEQTDID